MESYWNKQSEEVCKAKEPEEQNQEAQSEAETEFKEQGQDNGACSGIKVYQDSSEVEIEVTDANADEIAKTIEEETRLQNTMANLTEGLGPSPGTPPTEVIFRTTHSPIKFDTPPRKPVKERLGNRSVSPRREAAPHQGVRNQDETQRRTPVKDRLGQRTRRSCRCKPSNSLGQKFAPQTDPRKPWNQDQTGHYWYPEHVEDTDIEVGNVSSDQEEKQN